MITEYDVVSVSDLTVFKTKIAEALTKGWQPYEGLQVSTTLVNGVTAPLYTQALVKNVEPATPEEEFLVK